MAHGDPIINFDYEAHYYRILGYKGRGYLFNEEESKDIAAKCPPIKEFPYYEFDDLDSIDYWLKLGDRVLVLKIPRNAMVKQNTPIGQGGCMKYYPIKSSGSV